MFLLRPSRIMLKTLKNIAGFGILLFVIGFLVITFVTERQHNQDIEKSLQWIASETLEYPMEKYHIIPNIARPDTKPEVEHNSKGAEVVICTQTSIDNLHQVKTMAERWDGEISVAVFAYGAEMVRAMHYILLLHKCSPEVKTKARFHIVYPISKPPSDLGAIRDLDFSCGILNRLRFDYGKENYGHKLPYPVNVLRNVAIMYAGGTHVINLDVDFLMSKGLKKDLEEFLKRRNSRERLQTTAYVIPCFESDTSEDVHTKADLLRAVRKDKIRPFTVKKCQHCQANTNYSRWLALPYPSEMTSSYDVSYMPHYEPFYMADRQFLPMFDGRFKQYGFNRFSQICEMYVSGFKFAVLNNAFVVHAGFKDPGQFYNWKAQDNSINEHLFTMIFKRELKRKYPYSDRECEI